MGAVYVGAPDQIFRTSANNQAPFANFSARTPVHSHVRLPAPHAHAAVRSSTSASRAVYTHASCAKGVSRTIFDAYPLPKYASFRTLTRVSKIIDVKLFLHARMGYNPKKSTPRTTKGLDYRETGRNIPPLPPLHVVPLRRAC